MNSARKFLTLAPDRRSKAFEEAAARRNVNVVIIEKDFWVCWLLAELYSCPELEPHLVFKGGTSLSKVYGVIDRFSEDVDLSVSPEFAGADIIEKTFNTLTSRRSRDEAVSEMQRLCAVKTKSTIVPLLESLVRDTLGIPEAGESWIRYEVDSQAHSPNLYFDYPTNRSAGFEYVKRSVKLELGSLTDQKPTGKHMVRPWLAAEFPKLFEDWNCEVAALDLARTFWEKATILHVEHHRKPESAMPDRYSRHYSDLARMLEQKQSSDWLQDRELCDRVVRWKSHVFARAWGRYDLARHGSFRLVPPGNRIKLLVKDYKTMLPMFLREPPTFDRVLEQLSSAEFEMNAL